MGAWRAGFLLLFLVIAAPFELEFSGLILA
jgi:hypothetical protein